MTDSPFAPDRDQDPGNQEAPESAREEMRTADDEAAPRSGNLTQVVTGTDGEPGMPASEGAAEDAARAKGL